MRSCLIVKRSSASLQTAFSGRTCWFPTVDGMRQRRARTSLSLAACVAAIAAAGGVAVVPGIAAAAGSVNLASGVPYAQNFDTLAITGASGTVPMGWDLSEVGTNANTSYTSGTGSSSAGDTYSYGAAASTERAFGGLQSGSLVPTIGASFTNGAGGTITSLAVAYTGEQWRLGALSRTDRIDFQISTDATSLTTGTWVDVDALDLTGPTTTGSAGALDGNAVANRTAISSTIGSLGIANGATFWIRWNSFDAPGADDGLSVDDFSITAMSSGGGGGDAAPTVTSVAPVAGVTGVSVLSNVVVTFSEPVTATGAFSVSCATSGAHTVTVTGGPTEFTLDPAIDFVQNELCTVSVAAANVSDVDAIDPPDTMAAAFAASFTTELPGNCPNAPAITLISAVEGITDSSPCAGESVIIDGIVVGDYQGVSPTLRGYYVQEEDGDVDGDPATSEGIFVLDTANATALSLGDRVTVTGSVSEFQGQTQLTLSSSSLVSSGNPLPSAAIVSLPAPSATYFERFEGMRATTQQTLFVTETFQLARFGQVMASSSARLAQPTQVVSPGSAANALQASNDLNRILLDDTSQTQNPDPIVFGRGGSALSASNTLRGGDTVTGYTGVLTYTWSGNAASGNAWRLRPASPSSPTPNFQPTNPRPATAPTVGGTLKVAGMNVLNYFITLDTGSSTACGAPGNPQACRGAQTAQEFQRQRAKLLAALVKLDADIFGLAELENTANANPVADIVNGLNALVGTGTYAEVSSGIIGTDTIRVGMIYKPAKVTPVGNLAVLSSSVNPLFASTNRPALARTFQQVSNGETLTVVVNHLKSKGSCPASGINADQGDGQSCWNPLRTDAATALINWLGSNPTGVIDSDYLLLGDYNAYAKEDPISVITGAGYVDVADFYGDPYSYVFAGQWGTLDYAFASPSLAAQLSGGAEYHINADEPNALDYNTNFKSAGQITSLFNADEFRTSDHDPVVVGVNLGVTLPVDVPEVPQVWLFGLSAIGGFGLLLARHRGGQRKVVTVRG